MLLRVNSQGCPVGAMSTSPTTRWTGVFENAHAPQNIFPLVVHVGAPLPLIQNDESFLNGRMSTGRKTWRKAHEFTCHVHGLSRRCAVLGFGGNA
jgi:hypothetical protein